MRYPMKTKIDAVKLAREAGYSAASKQCGIQAPVIHVWSHDVRVLEEAGLLYEDPEMTPEGLILALEVNLREQTTNLTRLRLLLNAQKEIEEMAKAEKEKAKADKQKSKKNKKGRNKKKPPANSNRSNEIATTEVQ